MISVSALLQIYQLLSVACCVQRKGTSCCSDPGHRPLEHIRHWALSTGDLLIAGSSCRSSCVLQQPRAACRMLHSRSCTSVSVSMHAGRCKQLCSPH